MSSATAPAWYAVTNKTWGTVLDDSAKRWPEREAVVYGDERITYHQLRERVDRLASGLLRLGVAKGDRVALWMTNCPQWLTAQFAAYKIGAILVPVYTRFKEEETRYALAQSQSSTLIFNDEFLGKIDSLAMLRAICPELDNARPGELAAAALPQLRRVICLSRRAHDNLISYEAVAAGERNWLSKLAWAQAAVDPFDVMNMVYTSGTTGFPKGGLSLHRNNLASIYNTTARMGLNEHHRCLLNLPLFSNFGCMFVAALSFLRGAAVVLQETFDPVAAFKTIAEERITHLYGSPAYYIGYLDEPRRKQFDLSSLRGGIVGGSPLPSATMDAIAGDLGCAEILNVFGLSECGGIATTTKIDDPAELKRTTVGTPLPNARVKIVDPRTGKDAAPGEQGEICLGDALKGSCVGQGYYNMPEKTREAIDPDGWFHTGDLGVLDDHGYLRITGRVKDMFLCGGFNVYPVEIENMLHTHPKVKQAQVVGVPDHKLGEVCMAFVELREGVECAGREIVDFAARRIANYKVPRFVKFVRDFPMTGSGKVRKFVLREQAIAELNLLEEYTVAGAEHEQ
ncbi:MAG: AMP-binding protein [Deltaproteobacteria bacterium]|nr:AMP-binding protein [Deltaproteobacteria bacterium]